MFRSLIIFFLFVASILFLSLPNQVQASDGDYLSTKALKQLVKDKTVYAHTLKDKTKWQLKFQTDELAVFTYSNGTTKTVVYRIENNSICINFSAEAKDICRKLSKTENGYLWENAVTGKSSSEIYEINSKDTPVAAGQLLQETKEEIKKENKETIKIVSSSRPSRITSVAYSPSGEYFIAGSKDNTIRLWEASTRKQIRTFIGHTGSVNSVAYSPDGKFIISGSDDMTIRLWDARTGNVRHIFQGHTGVINSVNFSPNGKLIASGSADTDIRVWNVVTKKLKFILNDHKESVNAVVFSPDGIQFASGSGSGSGSEGDWSDEEEIEARLDNTIRIWSLKNGRLLHTLKGHKKRVNSVTYSKKGNILSASDDGVLRLWDSTQRYKLQIIENGWDAVQQQTAENALNENMPYMSGYFSVKKAIFSTDGKYILSVVGAMGETEDSLDFDVIIINNAKTGKFLNRIYIGHGENKSITVSPRNNLILIANKWDIDDFDLGDLRELQLYEKFRSVKLYNLKTFSSQGALKSKTPNLLDFIISRNNNKIVSANDAGWIRIWDITAGKEVLNIKAHKGRINTIDFSPDEKYLVTGGIDGLIKVWNVETGRELTVETNGFEDSFLPVNAIKFSENGDAILISRPFYLRPHQSKPHYKLQILKIKIENKKVIIPTYYLDPHDLDGDVIYSTEPIIYSTDRNHILSVVTEKNDPNLPNQDKSNDGFKTLLLFNTEESGILYESLLGKSKLHYVFSLDSSRFLLLLETKKSSDFQIRSVPDGKLLKSFSNTLLTEAELFELSPDNKTIVAKFPTGEISLWSASSGKLIKKLEGVLGKINTLAYTPDGTRIITGGADGKINIWDLQSGKKLLTLIGGTDKDEWLAITPEGFFNASPKGRSLVTVVKGFEMFNINQVYDHLYRPDLVKEALSGDKEGKLENAAYKLNLETIMASGPAPQLELKTRKTELAGSSVKLSVRVTDAGGGISNKIVWRVNGKARGDGKIPGGPIEDAVTVTQGLQLDPRQKNIITVTAYNEAGLLASVPLEITVDSQGGVDIGDRPRMHVLSIGIDKYEQPDYQLNYAVGDASAVGKMLKTVASSLYDKVEVTYLTDKEVTRDGLEQAFSKIAPKVRPHDVFVLYVAGHGKSLSGTYYYLPQDLNFKAGHGIKTHGIGQELWKTWLGKIEVDKSVLIFDTCESTEATKIRSTDIERETALDRLRHAHGHSSITAARQAAFEGYKGHGLLTYTILEALSKTVDGKKKEVDLSDLAKHITLRVPLISKQEFGSIQRPHNKIVGDFPFGIKTKGVLKAAIETIPKTPTHAINQNIQVRETPSIEAKGNRKLVAGYQVFVVKYYKDWALIARDGVKLGYVPQKALFKLQ